MRVEKATAADFGSQVGAGLTAIGDAGQALAAKLAANQKKITDFGYEKQFGELMEADNTAYAERMRKITGNGENHWVQSREETRARFDAWVKTLPPEARAEYEARAQRFAMQRTQQAFNDQYRQQDANVRVTLTEEQRKAGLAVQQSPQSFEQFRDAQFALIDKSPLTPLEKRQKKAELVNALAYTAEQARAAQNPAAYLGSTMPPGLEGMKAHLRRAEDFRANPYDDMGSLRIGYGSDTITKADGSVVKVGPGMVVTREDAERDLDRRIKTEFMPAAVKAIGDQAWGKLSPAAQAVMVSLSYNYGTGAWKGALRGVADAATTGDPQQLAAAVRALQVHNNGVNHGRRNKEADMILSGRGAGGPPPASMAALTPEQFAATQEIARRKFAEEIAAATATMEAEKQKVINQELLKIKEGPAPEETYRIGRKTGIFEDLSTIQRAEALLKERQKGDEDYALGTAIFGTGKANANRFSDKHNDGIAELYKRRVAGGEDPVQVAENIYQKTGMVARQFAEALRGALVSTDPKKFGAGLLAASGMMRDDPNAFAGVKGKSEIEAATVEYQRQMTLGFSHDEAIQRMMKDMREPADVQALKQEQLTQFKRDHMTQEKIDAQLQSLFDPTILPGGAPALPMGPQRTAMASIYSAHAEEGYRMYRDPAKARAYADHKVKQMFGVQNGVLMPYPPSKTGLPKLPGAADPYAWVNEQAAGHVKAFEGMDVPADRVLLMPVERGPVSTRAAIDGQSALVNRRDSKPGHETTFRSVPYQIMVMPDPDKPGDPVRMLPGVFYPDIETYVMEQNQRVASGLNETKKLEGQQVVERKETTVVFGGRKMKVPDYVESQVFETPEQAERRAADERAAKHRDAVEAERQAQLLAARKAEQVQEELVVQGRRPRRGPTEGVNKP